MKQHFSGLKHKFWFRMFTQIGIIFIVFVAVLTLCNSLLLSRYYEYTNKKSLHTVSKRLIHVDISDTDGTIDTITDIQDDYGFEVEIYAKSGKTYFSSSGGQMMNYLFFGGDKLNMNHRPLRALESTTYSDGSVMETAVDQRGGTEYLVYRFSLADGNLGELRVQVSLIENSAKIANTFIFIIAVIFLIAALLWVWWFSRRVARPISEMNTITRDMAELKFTTKLKPESADEIGQLASSINVLSGTLDKTLMDLQASNAQLRNEIELEHQLDVMRRGFVANVSHELKTPISIIQGYAEGLKMDINSNSKERYCDIIMDESHRMNRLVLGLLSLSKYESGQIPLNMTEFSLDELVHAKAERIFADQDVQLVYDLPQNLMVVADCDQIEQVVKSYLENAASHVNAGGEVRVHAAVNDKQVATVSVFNTGSHIDEAIMPQIWQSFFRGDTSHKRESSRFGLGLSIVSAIIKLHGQTCGVYNTQDGVCFWFTVQVAGDGSQPVPAKDDATISDFANPS